MVRIHVYFPEWKYDAQTLHRLEANHVVLRMDQYSNPHFFPIIQLFLFVIILFLSFDAMPQKMYPHTTSLEPVSFDLEKGKETP